MGIFNFSFFSCRDNSHSGVMLQLKGFPSLAVTAVKVTPLLRKKASLPAEALKMKVQSLRVGFSQVFDGIRCPIQSQAFAF